MSYDLLRLSLLFRRFVPFDTKNKTVSNSASRTPPPSLSPPPRTDRACIQSAYQSIRAISHTQMAWTDEKGSSCIADPSAQTLATHLLPGCPSPLSTTFFRVAPFHSLRLSRNINNFLLPGCQQKKLTIFLPLPGCHSPNSLPGCHTSPPPPHA